MPENGNKEANVDLIIGWFPPIVARPHRATGQLAGNNLQAASSAGSAFGNAVGNNL